MGIIILTVFRKCAGSSDTPKRFATRQRGTLQIKLAVVWRRSSSSKINSPYRHPGVYPGADLSYQQQKVRKRDQNFCESLPVDVYAGSISHLFL